MVGTVGVVHEVAIYILLIQAMQISIQPRRSHPSRLPSNNPDPKPLDIPLIQKRSHPSARSTGTQKLDGLEFGRKHEHEFSSNFWDSFDEAFNEYQFDPFWCGMIFTTHLWKVLGDDGLCRASWRPCGEASRSRASPVFRPWP